VQTGLYDVVIVPKDELEPGTLTDVRYIAPRYVSFPIYPGELFRASDFSKP
jgi:hypothetical protein